MNIDIPPPLRAAAGLAGRTYDEARALPNRLVSLPVLAIGAALQVSLRVQQHYASLVARGDELITVLRGASDGPPPWATFDDDAAAASPARPGFADSAFDRAAFDRADAVFDHALSDHALFDTTVPDPAAVNPAETTEPTPSVEVNAQPDAGAAPLAGYDSWTIAQLRARLRKLSSDELAALLRYEQGGRARAAYLTMLENRLAGPRPRR